MKTYWASRDTEPSVYADYIKIWNNKPELSKHIGKWRAGFPNPFTLIIIKIEEWENIASYSLDKGVCVEVKMSFNFSCPGSEE